MNIIVILLSIFGLTFFLTQSDGPFGIMSWARNKLIDNETVGVFFYKLFICPFCCGCWSGAVIYLLSSENYSFGMLWTYVFAGGAISYLGSLVCEALTKDA